MNKFVKWLNKKKVDDDFLTQILKLGLSIGKRSWVHAITSAVLGIVIPICFGYKNNILFVILTFF